MCMDTTRIQYDKGHDEVLGEIRTGVPNLIWGGGEGGCYLHTWQDVAK